MSPMGVVERLHFEDVEGIRVGRFTGRINTTCILYRVGDTLIDTGSPNQWRAVRAFLEEKPVRQVAVTHHHEDHAGNLARLQGKADRPLLAPAESLELLASGFPLQVYRRIIWGQPGLARAEPLPASLPLAAGGGLEPVLLPGHSPDMTCLLERSRGVLFGADLYISSRPRYLRQDEDLTGILQSLRRALALDFGTLLCSHRGVLLDAKEALQRKLDYLVSLSQQASELHSQGIAAASITRRLLGREDSVSLISLGHFSKRNLIRECLRVSDGQSPDS